MVPTEVSTGWLAAVCTLRATRAELLDRGAVVEHDEELVAAVPGHLVLATHRPLEPIGHRRDHGIADEMAVPVVDGLEVVDVAEQHPDGAGGLRRHPQPLGQAGLERLLVGQAGLQVVAGAVGQVGLQPAGGRAVGELVHEQRGVAEVVAHDADRVVDPDLAGEAGQPVLAALDRDVAPQQALAPLVDLLALLLGDVLPEPVPDERLGRGPEQLAQGRVDLHDPVLGVGDRHALGRAEHGHPELLLAARQLALGPQLLGHVAHGDRGAAPGPGVGDGAGRDRHVAVGPRTSSGTARCAWWAPGPARSRPGRRRTR